MVVGDAKQAIYRWRNGEVEQFIVLPKIYQADASHIIKSREKVFIDNQNEKELVTNYRSKKEIIHFNNSFFTTISEGLPEFVNAIYTNAEQQAVSSNTGGYVHFEWLEEGPEYEESTYEKIKNYIEENINLGYNLKDIAIICRKNKEGSKIARYLIKNNIQVVSSESLLLCKSLEVNFILSVLRIMINPDDHISKAILLRFLKQESKLSSNSLHKYFSTITEKNSDDNGLTLDDIANIAGSKKKSATWKSMSLYDLIEDIVRAFELNIPYNPYITFFLDSILQAFEKRKYSINDFLSWWDNQKEKLSIVLPETLDAVRILTIHKSKGLEFPVVIFPFSDFSVTPFGNKEQWIKLEDTFIDQLPVALIPVQKSLQETSYCDIYENESDKSYLDMVNLLYVTFTRAKDRLYIIQKYRTSKGNANTVSSLFHLYFKKSGVYEEGKYIYEFGSASFADPDPVKHTNNTLHLDEFISDDWKRRILISLNSPAKSPESEQSRKWGDIIHKLLSQVYYLEDFQTILDDIKINPLYNQDEKAQLIKTINQLFDHDIIKELFDKSWKVMNEKEIIIDDAHSIRPDRIILKGNTIKIIDYKTGKPDKANFAQIENYASILEDMGYQIDGKYLIYINDDLNLYKLN